MKKIYLTMFVAILGIATSQAKREPDFTAQDFAKYNIDDFDGVADGKADFIAAALAIKSNFGLTPQGFVGQTTVIDCPGMNKQDIYTQVALWLQSFCENDKKAELRLDPNQGSTLVAKKRLRDVAGDDFKKIYDIKKRDVLGNKINILINIRVDIKDNKCRLTTTIEDYGIESPSSNGGAWGAAAASGGLASLIGAAVGSAISSAMKVDETMKPANNFPFKEKVPFRNQEKGEKDEKYLKKKEKYDKEWEDAIYNDKTPAIAYVASFILTQIVHDKMLTAITAAPSFGNDDNW